MLSIKLGKETIDILLDSAPKGMTKVGKEVLQIWILFNYAV